ncbi:MAG: hydrolase [Eubacteriales bacterium]|nr:hydrolase [Eubacteriales bacterium]
MKVEILILNKNTIYQPVVEGVITVNFALNTVGKMEFTVVKDDIISFHEGNPVVLKLDGVTFFKGFVFTKSRNKDNLIKVVCFDQMRYLKNKDTYQYGGITYSKLLIEICKDRGLKTGYMEDTKFILPERIEKNKEYLQILQTAGDITMKNTGNIFFLADEAGSLCLRDITKTKVDYPVTVNNMSNFELQSSIDNSYNRIRLAYESKNKVIEHKTKEDAKNIEKWGMLQYYEEVKTKENIEARAEELLKMHNRVKRSLKLRKVLGNTLVREGRIIPVSISAALDMSVQEYMLVTEATHSFEGGHHFMDLTVQGERF